MIDKTSCLRDSMILASTAFLLTSHGHDFEHIAESKLKPPCISIGQLTDKTNTHYILSMLCHVIDVCDADTTTLPLSQPWLLLRRTTPPRLLS